MQKRLLSTPDDWHSWTADLIGRGFHIGYYSPPSFPCVIVWMIDESGHWNSIREVRYEFVETSDF